MAADQLDIFNRAVGRIAGKPVADVEENSLEARECRRFYPSVISNMLEAPQEWSFAKQRVLLASVANLRPNEWVSAYQLPSNCASPVRLIPDLAGLGLGVPIPLPGEPYAETWWFSTFADIEAPYVLDGTTIFTNEVNATLEYVVNDIAGLNVSQLVIEAIRLQLAAEIAIPVKKDSALRKDILGEAEIAWERAIADDRNRQPETYGDYVSETLLARHGFYGSC
jgi:hypothetical protein